MTEREALVEQLPEGLWVSPAATLDDLRYMLRYERGLAEGRWEQASSGRVPRGVVTQIGGNRVQLTANGIAVRPQYEPRRG